jgi:hypothetical protein
MDRKCPWPFKKEDLTSEEANFIRSIRCQPNHPFGGYTWRAVSEAFCERFYPEAAEWPACKGNQGHGSDLCKFAAEHFDEDYYQPPWN